MANEDSVLREVDQELAEDRQWSMFRKYGPAAIGASLALLVGVGAWQFYSGGQDRAASKSAVEFNEALKTLEADPIEGRSALEAIAEGGAGGYAVLAEFRRAASLAADGNTETAVAAFQSIYENSAAPKALRDLARVRAGYLSLATGRDAALAHIGDLADGAGPYRFHASEIEGLGALKAGDYEAALSIFRRIADDFTAPQSLSARADEFAALALSGKSGVNLTGEFRLDDVIGAIGEITPAEETDSEGAQTADDGEADAEASRDNGKNE